jgi:hypothetical protein
LTGESAVSLFVHNGAKVSFMIIRVAAVVLAASTLAFAAAESALSTPADPTLKVRVTGKGTVTSNPTGIRCPKKCSAHFATDARVTLVPHPAKGWSFSTWSGGCQGSRGCVTKLVLATTVRAKFIEIPVSPPAP